MSVTADVTTRGTDFSYAPGDDLADLGGPASRFNHNVAAIRLLKALEAERRAPGTLTPEEQRTLARYTGWGDGEVIARAFPGGAHSSAKPCAELEVLLTEEEVAGLLGSTLNAHYTSVPVIRAIYDALVNLGAGDLARLRVLEPAAGVGNFLGAMPACLSAKAERVAVELDGLSARILRRLYPETRVFGQAFEQTALPQGFFDLIISNVPFGNYAVSDPQIKQKHLKAAIHDYYFARSLNLLRPGGVIAFITSRYTLDKMNDRVRRHIAESADLLAAVRLPEGAFRRNAGTEVVTDVLILRKRAAPVNSADETLAWVKTGEITLTDARGESRPVTINSLFAARPSLMLGRPALARRMYREEEFTLEADDRDLPAALREALVAQLPPRILSGAAAEGAAPVGAAESVDEDRAGAVNLDEFSGAARHRNVALLDLYGAAKKVIRLQLLDADDELLGAAQKELNQLYDRFRARFGFTNAKQNLRDLKKGSPLVPFLKALEEPTGKGSYRKAAFFTARTIRPVRRTAQASSAKEALLLCLNERGRVDVRRIAGLAGQSTEDAVKALDGLIYETPSGDYQTAEEYLSGNVIQKLGEAEAAAAIDPRFRANVEALASVIPTPLTAEQIAARLGSGWIPAEVVAGFIKELVPQFEGKVGYLESLGTWKIENPGYWARTSIEATETWGTARQNAIDLVDDALNLRTPTVYDEVTEGGEARRVLNDAETVAAQAKLAEIRLKFAAWVWLDEARARRLCEIYNGRYNCLRGRRYDGSHLQLPGMNSAVTLRPHQLDGIWRILQSKATLLGHSVGAGKTYLMIAAAMELRRLGLCHKVMAVVPNHLPAQWEAEARRLYPNIRVLAPAKDELSRSQRGELMSRIATGSHDLVIVPHSAFKLLPLSPERVAAYVRREIGTLEEYLEDIPPGERGDRRNTVKEIQRAIKKLRARLETCEAEIRRDSRHTMTWEELGVDALLIDESHLYKNLYIPTKLKRVAGLPTGDSQRAFDAFLKVRDLLDRGGRVVFATATPVSNTLAEVYVNMKFLQLDLLKETGLAHFDAWTQMFAETTESLEMKPDGSGFRINTRFNKFTNLPELAALWRQALDVRTPEQLNLPRPSVAGGGPQVVSVPASPALKAFVKSLAARVEEIKNRRVAPEQDNMLKVTGEGRKAALDLRLVLPGNPAPEHSKVKAVVEKIVEFYRQSEDRRGCQVVFCDLATPKSR
jgi:N12 class adenine-specific DNA methylase